MIVTNLVNLSCNKQDVMEVVLISVVNSAAMGVLLSLFLYVCRLTPELCPHRDSEDIDIPQSLQVIRVQVGHVGRSEVQGTFRCTFLFIEFNPIF